MSVEIVNMDEIDFAPDRASDERRRMRLAGVGERHIRHLCDGRLVDCDALRAVREFLADRSRQILVLSGDIGTRKTGSACWMLGQRDGGLFVKARDLLDLKIDDTARFRALQKCRFVVLDDVKADDHDAKGVWLTTFTGLFDEWYENCEKLIITGNFGQIGNPPLHVDGKTNWEIEPFEEFHQLYGERIKSRLREAGGLLVIGGEDARRERQLGDEQTP
jgi:hypothetical protein